MNLFLFQLLNNLTMIFLKFLKKGEGMKKVATSLKIGLGIILLTGIIGCSNKNSEEDVIVNYYKKQKIEAIDKKYGCNLESYIDIDRIKIINKKNEGKDYEIVEVKPRIKILKSIDKNDVETIAKKCKKKEGEVIAYLMLRTLEIMKKYKGQDLNGEKGLKAGGELLFSKPEGNLKKGDEIDLEKEKFKLRKTNKGWEVTEIKNKKL
jgi:hypothetical protein